MDVQKRRIYDITNVLEGVGLIEKTRYSSVVKWRGSIEGEGEDGMHEEVIERSEHLKALEDDIDMQLDYATRNLRYIQEDAINQSFAYLSRDDLLSVFGDRTVLTIPSHDEDVEIYKLGKVGVSIFFFI